MARVWLPTTVFVIIKVIKISNKIEKVKELGIGEIRQRGEYLSIDYFCAAETDANVLVPLKETVTVEKDLFTIGHVVDLLDYAYQEYSYLSSTRGQKDWELENGSLYEGFGVRARRKRFEIHAQDLQARIAQCNQAIAKTVMKYHNMTKT